MVRQLVPEWAGIDGPDPGTALVEACAAMVAALVERVNRAPDKERLAVLSELRVWPRPAAPGADEGRVHPHRGQAGPGRDPGRHAGGGRAVRRRRGGLRHHRRTRCSTPARCLNSGMYRAGQYLAEQQTFTGLLSALGQEIVLTADDVLLAVLSRPVPDTQITLDLQVDGQHVRAGAGRRAAWPGKPGPGTRWVPCEVVEDSTAALTRSGHVTLHIPRQQAPTAVELNLGTAQAPQQWRAEDVGLLRCRQAGDAAVTVALTGADPEHRDVGAGPGRAGRRHRRRPDRRLHRGARAAVRPARPAAA